MNNKFLHNSHLDGGPFFWEAGATGILLLHGFTATTAEVRPLAKRLHEQGYTVAGPLLPGHGSNPEDLNQTPWQAWVQAAERAYRQLSNRCQRVFIAGESMGGVTTLYLASQHPEAAGVIGYAPAIKLAMNAFDLLKLYLASPFMSAVPKKLLGNVENWQGYSVNPLRGVVQLRKLQKEVRHRLPQIRQPLMIIQGSLDETIHPSSGQIILRGVSSTEKEIHWLKHSPHVVVLGPELDELTELTLRFIERVLRKTNEY